MRFLWRWAVTVSLLGTLAGPAQAQTPPPIQINIPRTAQSIVRQLTPAEKVGQLALVTFYGSSVEPGSDIHQLISQHHIGGVVLLAANDNFTEANNPAEQAQKLIGALQNVAAQASAQPRAVNGITATRPFVPLFIATRHAGEAYPYAEIRAGLTDLPNPLALGATWSPAQAEAVGRIAGQELSAVGFNLLLGPALDVLENPRPQGAGDLGTRSFGGDPYWVGALGQAFIRGVHGGSDNRLAVIAKSFPGYGSSDRDPEQEVPTVRKSLEQLKQIELAAFFAVTHAPTNTASAADGLLTAHIRFQGFQGNIRQTTRPVSFDQQALSELLALPELAAWRERGGLMVSDALGVPAVRRFFDPAERTFNNRRIALEAFTAGNDLLLLADFGLNPRSEHTRNIIDTLNFFTQRYQEDAAFAARVDASVERIVALKWRLYAGEPTPEKTKPNPSALATLGQGAATVAEVARNAVTLLSPAPEELNVRLPDPPAADEPIVFFTDVRLGRQCSTCPTVAYPHVQSFERAVLQIYGPQGSGVVAPRNLSSFSFEELSAYLRGEGLPPTPVVTATPEATATPALPRIEVALRNADWVVLNMLNPSADLPGSRVITRFLAERADLLRTKRVIVFAFDAPYYLDSTDLAKLTAFYGVYSRTPASFEAAARALFRDLNPMGAPPVSVPSIGYNLIQALAPNPRQIIRIESAQQEGKVGDTLNVRTSPILDRNGRPVPDGTPARFTVFISQTNGTRDFQFIDAVTRNGVAQMALTLDRTGVLEISVTSEPAQTSSRLQFIVLENQSFTVTEVVPPTATPEPSATPTVTPILPSATPSVTPTPTATPAPPAPGRPVASGDFALLLAMLALAWFLGYQAARPYVRPALSVRLGLLGMLGVLAGYNLVAGRWLAGPPLGWMLAGALLALSLGWLGLRARR